MTSGISTNLHNSSQGGRSVQFSSVQSLSRVRLSATPWIAARQASLSISNSRSSLKPMPIESVMPSSHLILCRPLLLLPPVPPSIRVFSSESALRMRWPEYRSFGFKGPLFIDEEAGSSGSIGTYTRSQSAAGRSPTPARSQWERALSDDSRKLVTAGLFWKIPLYRLPRTAVWVE